MPRFLLSLIATSNNFKMAVVEEDLLKEIINKISKNDISEAKKLIARGGIDANAVDEHGMSLLQHAAYKGNREMVQLLLDQGADVNGGSHEHQYTALHFAALSGKTEVCQLLLNYGAKVHAVNSVGRTPAQMAAFVGNHTCVAAINNFISKSDVDYFAKPNGLENEPKLPPILVEPLHKFVTGTNVHPVKVALTLKKLTPLCDYLDKVKKVLELMSERQMKMGQETNEIMSLKLHYLATVVEELSKTKKNQEAQHENKQVSNIGEEGSKKCDAVELFIRKMLRVDRSGETPDQNSFLMDSVRSFHARESTIFRQMVSQLVRADAPNPLTIIAASVNGQRGFADNETECWTCGEEGGSKKCSKCKNVRYCDRECQRLHWFVHKKQCNRATTSPETGKPVDQQAVQSAVKAARSQFSSIGLK